MNSFTLISGNNLLDTTTAGIAASAVSSPIWLPWLEGLSTNAAMFAPILGSIWLVVQILSKVREMCNRKDPFK